ncbi:hypothetical protein [Halobacterium yunchengense]|uniref:hypothetical protein n=1 Tax=Halobacterium yunchengense TaxID=3108497 RepID=UPI00300B2B1F
MALSDAHRRTLRTAGLVAATAISLSMAVALLAEPRLLAAAHPLPLVGAFLVVAAATAWLAVQTWRAPR